MLKKDYTYSGYTLRITQCNSSQAYMGTILEDGTTFFGDTIREVIDEYDKIVEEREKTNDYNSCKNCKA